MLRMGSVADGRRVPDLGLNEVPSPLPRRGRPVAGPEESAKTEDETPVDRDEMHKPLTGIKASQERNKAENSVGFPERDTHGRKDPGWRWKDLLSSMPEDDDGSSRGR